ncbi:MAG: hypothetical protein M9891_16270 [Austwickia sp.]|nr:hypothetical protein [Austwickia sp.]MCO5310808.1 hypothetical protein [Austwickia sp.]
MVSTRVDTSVIGTAARRVASSGRDCAGGVVQVSAGLGQMAGGVGDGALASAARSAVGQWARSVAICAGAAEAVGLALEVAESQYDAAERTATASFARSA